MAIAETRNIYHQHLPNVFSLPRRCLEAHCTVLLHVFTALVSQFTVSHDSALSVSYYAAFKGTKICHLGAASPFLMERTYRPHSNDKPQLVGLELWLVLTVIIHVILSKDIFTCSKHCSWLHSRSYKVDGNTSIALPFYS